MVQPLGGLCLFPVRDRTQVFHSIRREQQKNRDLYSDVFRVLPYSSSSSTSIGTEDHYNGVGLLQGVPKSQFIIEHGKDVLPPGWKDDSDGLQEKIDQIQEKYETLEKLHAKKRMPQFDEGEAHRLDRQIQILIREITDKLREAEVQVKRISQFEDENQPFDSNVDKRIRKNIQISYANKLREITLKLRKEEKQQIKRMEQFNEYGSDEVKGGLDQDDIAVSLQDNEVLELDQMNQEARLRGVEIANLVKSINELATIYKQLSVLVIHQGTIIDRIDYNMEKALEQTTTGLKDLKIAEKTQKCTRAVTCLICLITMIFVMVVLFMLKKM